MSKTKKAKTTKKAKRTVKPRPERAAKKSLPSATFRVVLPDDHASTGTILFTDCLPGAHATMFGPDGASFPYRPESSTSDDAGSLYTWGFDLMCALVKGDRLVFVVADREVVGEVLASGEIAVTDDLVEVERDAGGKPLALKAT